MGIPRHHGGDRLPVVHLGLLSVATWPARADRSSGGGRPGRGPPRGHRPAGRRRAEATGEPRLCGAWSATTRAVAGAPGSKAAREEQTQIAMAWIRDMRVTAPATFTSTVMPLSEHLNLALATATGPLAADIRAHMGYSNFLRYREGARDLKIEEEYAAAVALDPPIPSRRPCGATGSPFSTGHWRNEGAIPHRPHVRTGARLCQRTRLAALKWHGRARRTSSGCESPMKCGAITSRSRWRHDSRSSGTPIRAGPRRRTGDAGRLARGRPPRDVSLAGRGPRPARRPDRIVLPRAADGSGRGLCGAAALYRPLLSLNSTFQEKIKAGLARCE